MSRCTIESNRSDGVYCYGGNLTLVNCLLEKNGGDGLRVVNGPVTAIHNTFAGNRRDGIDAFRQNKKTIVYNNIFCANREAGVSGRRGLMAHDYNIVFANTRNFAGVIAGKNSLLVDPGFLYAKKSDYHFSKTSVAIDAASSSSAYSTSLDIEGLSRPLGVANDIGCYESHYQRRVKIESWVEVR